MRGEADDDTYKGYRIVPASGVDNIIDTAGSPDKLDLTSFNEGCGDPGCEHLFLFGHDGDNVLRHLVIDFADGSTIRLINYFDGTVPVPLGPDDKRYCESGAGPGLIETIIFADDPNVDFAQVLSDPAIGGCGPQATGAASAGGVQDHPQGSIRAIALETAEPSNSSVTTTAISLTPETPKPTEVGCSYWGGGPSFSSAPIPRMASHARHAPSYADLGRKWAPEELVERLRTLGRPTFSGRGELVAELESSPTSG